MPFDALRNEQPRSAGRRARTRTFVDVFAGCGGLSLGLKKAGWKGLFAIEKDEFAFETLSTNFPGKSGPLSYSWPASIERKAWDIRELLDTRKHALKKLRGTVDLLAGGPPCQGFSQAGKRRADDPRNQLFEAYLELVNLLEPRLVLIENVRGFTTAFDAHQAGSITNFAETLEARLQKKYDTSNRIVLSSEFGIPQRRSRFLLVGALRTTTPRSRVEEFFDRLSDQRATFLTERGLSARPSSRDAISDLEVRRNGTMACSDSAGFEAIAYAGPRTSYQRYLRAGFEGSPSDTRLARHAPEIRARFTSIIQTCIEEGRLNTTISKETRATYGLRKAALRVLDPLNPAPTITSLPDDLLHYSEPRTLTVRENARLQSFPDWFAFKGKYTTGGHRRRLEVPRFTQVANAVPPLLAEQIGRALHTIIDKQSTTERAPSKSGRPATKHSGARATSSETRSSNRRR